MNATKHGERWVHRAFAAPATPTPITTSEDNPMTATHKPGDRVRLVGEFIVDAYGDYESAATPEGGRVDWLNAAHAERLSLTVEVIAPPLPPEPPVGSVVVLRSPDGAPWATRHWKEGDWSTYGTWANVCAAGAIAAVVEPEVTS
jgi:hypothetical protein